MEQDEVRFDKRLPTIQISQEMLEALEAVKRKTGKGYAVIVRAALRQYLKGK